MHDAVAEPGHGLREQDGEGVHALGDAAQPFGPVIHGVHARHHGEEHLRGADVARGLLAPAVPRAALHRHAERGTAGGIARYADDAAGHVAPMGLPRREERRVRAAVAHRYAEPLRVPHGDVRAPLPRRHQHGEGEQVGRDRHERPRGMRLVTERAVVLDLPLGRGILQQRADHAGAELETRGIRDDGLHAARLRPGAHDRDRLRVASLRNHEHRRGAGGTFATASVRFIASAAAVASSSREALAIGRAVRSATIVWKLSRASSRPCAISGWYGVYAVYQPGFSTMLRWMTWGVKEW